MKWAGIFQTGLEINQSVMAKAEEKLRQMHSRNVIFKELFLVRYLYATF